MTLRGLDHDILSNYGYFRYTVFFITIIFFYKDLFYKNVEAEVEPDVKNMLRTYST